MQARLRHASAKTTLDTYGHLWPDRDDTSRAAVAAVYQEGETACPFYEFHVFVDVLDPDPDGYIRAYSEDIFVPVEIGQFVSVDCDEVAVFARVVTFEPNGGPDWIAVLEELKGEEAEQAAEDLALSYEDWCDPIDEWVAVRRPSATRSAAQGRW